jgi:hypothetical protein
MLEYVSIALCAVLSIITLVAIVQHDMRLERSTYEVFQILIISLTDKTPLKELFEKTNFNDVKEQFSPPPHSGAI